MHLTKITIAIAILFFGCSQSQNEEQDSTAKSEVSSNAYSSLAAVENGKDTTRRFIRTAELKFKVKSVIQTTYNIENITANQGGFVSYTKLTSDINNVTTTAVSADSSLETTYYTVTNTITLRVPNTKLDTTLKEIALNIDFLDYRIIKAEDVALQVLANNLTQKRASKNEERLANAIDSKGRKLTETTDAEELLLSKQEEGDNAKISNLSLSDQIKYSTINIAIYQRQTIKRELILNEKNIDEFEPSFGSKIIESLKFGWKMIASFLIFLTKLWGLYLFALIGYVIYKKFGHKLK